ncbi:MAG TPA: hypothetical protein ACFYD6_08465 [Candidatus Brocadiia bacterium]|nr:hypothetical protein [Planctomycetota bacterium]MDO8093401.1 hypothetical protein [Candidatus Brocadiales bacterium]
MRKSKKIIMAFLLITIAIVGAYCHALGRFAVANNTPLRGAEEQEAWTGIDVSIVGKYATNFGRPPRNPYINTDRGDLLLCLFTLGGSIGGFIIGYNWHKLMKSR